MWTILLYGTKIQNIPTFYLFNNSKKKHVQKHQIINSDKKILNLLTYFNKKNSKLFKT